MANTLGGKFKFTKDDLYNMVVGALNEQPAQGGAAKPNAIQALLAKTKLGKKE
jgi:hypothetical protein